MIALSFLGLGHPEKGYSETTYTWQNEPCTTHLFPEAVAKLFGADELIVAMTKEAEARYHDELAAKCDALDGLRRYTPVRIPSGKRAADQWETFEALTAHVPDGADLLIDITHGFRSQPLLALAAALYLQAARGVTVQRIVYGAFGGERSPIVDLTPFLTLTEWSVAARQFLRDGDASTLAGLMGRIQGDTHRSGADVKARHAKGAGHALSLLTDAMSVVRARKVVEDQASDVVRRLGLVREEAQQIEPLRPLGSLIEQVQAQVAPMQADDLFSDEGFAAQVAVMRFYLDTRQYQQAVTLAREAMVSRRALDLGLDPSPVSKADRRAGVQDGRYGASETTWAAWRARWRRPRPERRSPTRSKRSLRSGSDSLRCATTSTTPG